MPALRGASSRKVSIHSDAILIHFGAPNTLEPVRLSGRKGINNLFGYALYLTTPNALVPGVALYAVANLDLADSVSGGAERVVTPRGRQRRAGRPRLQPPRRHRRHAGHALSAAQGVFMPYVNKFPALDFLRATRGFIGAVRALAI